MDSRQQDRETLGNKIADFLKQHELQHMDDADGGGYLLVDALTPEGAESVEFGVSEIEHIASEIAWLVIPSAVSASTDF